MPLAHVYCVLYRSLRALRSMYNVHCAFVHTYTHTMSVGTCICVPAANSVEKCRLPPAVSQSHAALSGRRFNICNRVVVLAFVVFSLDNCGTFPIIKKKEWLFQFSTRTLSNLNKRMYMCWIKFDIIHRQQMKTNVLFCARLKSDRHMCVCVCLRVWQYMCD